MFRLIEAGIVAVFSDLAALVIFAPLLALAEELFGGDTKAAGLSPDLWTVA